MLFSGIPFLFYFLPVVLILYFSSPKKLKNAVLLLSSLVFYGWGEPRLLIFMMIAILQGYVFGLLIEKYGDKKRSKIFLTASVILSFGILGYYKYADFFIENFNALTGASIPLLKIALPIGISFYTFQILSYVIDVYRKDVAAQRNFIDLAAYIAMFPQLIAGPIVRYSDIAAQLKEREHTLEKVAEGTRRFILGLGKKVLLANVLGEVVATFKASDEKSVLFYWVYAVSYLLHIYFDFSGYSDMAIGLGKIFGFEFLENFNYPYIASSVTDFWRRWHMSLSGWFRDYLYIPLGGNRVSRPRFYLNILIVWMATGFWHGADWTFILWGLYFALLLILEKMLLMKLLEKMPLIRHLYLLFFVLISFVLFDAGSLSQAIGNIGGLFGAGEIPAFSAEGLHALKDSAVLLLIGGIGATPLPKMAVKALSQRRAGAWLLTFGEPLVLAGVMILCTAFLVDGSFNPFLYFRF